MRVCGELNDYFMRLVILILPFVIGGCATQYEPTNPEVNWCGAALELVIDGVIAAASFGAF